MKKILFVCIENSCRSQMAEAYAKIHGKNFVEAYSSGSSPSGIVNNKAVAALSEIGYDLSQHRSKGLDEFADIEFDYVVTMGCGDKCPYISAKHREDWKIPDPKHMNETEFRNVRDMVEEKVMGLLEQLQS